MMAITYRKVFVRAELLVFCFLIFVGFWTEKVLANEHAMLHGDLAIKSAQCVDGQGETLEIMHNPDTERLAIACQDKVTGKMFVLVISFAGAIITAFCNKSRTKDEAKKYLAHRGYRDL
jgi:hypothetical protein